MRQCQHCHSLSAPQFDGSEREQCLTKEMTGNIPYSMKQNRDQILMIVSLSNIFSKEEKKHSLILYLVMEEHMPLLSSIIFVINVANIHIIIIIYCIWFDQCRITDETKPNI